MGRVLPKSDNEAKAIAVMSSKICLAIFSIILILIILFENSCARLLSLEKCSNIIWLLPIVLLTFGFVQIATQWLIRKKMFVYISVTGIIHSIITNIGKIAVGFYVNTGFSLVSVYSLASFLHIIILYFGMSKADHSKSWISEKITDFTSKNIVRKYYDFPVYRTPQIFLGSIGESLPVLMLASFFGPESAGFYNLGRSVLGLPALLLSRSIVDVLYPKLAEANNSAQALYPLVKKSTLGLLMAGIIPYGTIFLFGPDLFSFVFGERWLIAGEFARWLSVWLFFSCIRPPCTSCIPVIKKQLFLLIYEIISLVARALSIWIGAVYFASPVITIKLFTLVNVVSNVFLIIVTLIFIIKHDKLRK